MSVTIAPSILSADFAALGEAVRSVSAGGADWIHVDVMDGRFVPNITIGIPVVAALRRVSPLPLDVHLMIVEPERYVEAFIDAGAASVSVHVEATPHLHRVVTRIRDLGALAGAAINPATPLQAIEDIGADLDIVILMSVNPGFGGQAFIPSALDKLRRIRERIDRSGRDVRLEIDGGVKPDNMRAIAAAGADTFVAGSAIFNADDYGAVIKAMRSDAAAAHA